MDLRQPGHSAFSRFSDKLKESARRKSTVTPMLSSPSSLNSQETEGRYSRRPSRDDRRSSTAQFTGKMWQMLSPSARPTTSINDLPVEVLHHMLLYLDFWDLLKCQRVCRLWKNLIPGDSPLLSEVLYLKPSRSLQIYSSVPATFDFDFDVGYEGHPKYGEDGCVMLGTPKILTMTRRCVALIRTSSEIVFHPVIMNFDHYLHNEVFRGISEENGNRPKDERGSWESMLVSMPPLQELGLRYGRSRQMYRLLRVTNGDEGIRLGDLVQAMDEWDDFSGGCKEKEKQPPPKRATQTSRLKDVRRWYEREPSS